MEDSTASERKDYPIDPNTITEDIAKHLMGSALLWASVRPSKEDL
jgi:hypothetical protein